MAKIKFSSQRDRSSCGPVALANARKYLGHKTNTRDFTRKMRRYLGTTGCRAGTMHYQMYMLICKDRHLFQKWEETITIPTIKQLDERLKENKAIILAVEWPDKHRGHYTFVVKRAGNSYFCANYGKKTISRVPREYMKKLLRFKRYDGSKAFVFARVAQR